MRISDWSSDVCFFRSIGRAAPRNPPRNGPCRARCREAPALRRSVRGANRRTGRGGKENRSSEHPLVGAARPAERRVGKDCASTCSSRSLTDHEKQKQHELTKKRSTL